MPSSTAPGHRSEPGLELGLTYLPTTVRGICLFLYLVIDLWSRKVVVWDVSER